MESETQEEAPKQENKTETTPQTEPTADTGDRQPVETQDKIERAKEEADRLEKAHERFTEDIARLEKLKADEILGGRSDKSQPPEKPKEMTEDEYANALLEGKIKFKDE